MLVESLTREVEEDKSKLIWKVLIIMAVFTGLRRSELLGLEWKHIDFESGYLSVMQGLTFTKETGYVIGDLKTRNSKRKVAFPLLIGQELKQLQLINKSNRLKAGELWEGAERDFVFVTNFGKPVNPDSVKKISVLRHILTTWDISQLGFYQRLSVLILLMLNLCTLLIFLITSLNQE